MWVCFGQQKCSRIPQHVSSWHALLGCGVGHPPPCMCFSVDASMAMSRTTSRQCLLANGRYGSFKCPGPCHGEGLQPDFDLSQTYFLVVGVGGINLNVGRAGSIPWCVTQWISTWRTNSMLVIRSPEGQFGCWAASLRCMPVSRAAPNFERPHPGQSALESLNTKSGGYPAATANLYNAAWPVVRDIVSNWEQWRVGVPLP